jgi:hypothetical protein
MNLKLKVGAKVKVIANTSSHSYKIGETYEIINLYYSGSQVTSVQAKFPNGTAGNSLYLLDIECVAYTIEDFEEANKDLIDQLEATKKEISDNEERIAWMKENNIVEFNETEFKAFKTLTLLEDDSLSKMEKAKLISELVNQ